MLCFITVHHFVSTFQCTFYIFLHRIKTCITNRNSRYLRFRLTQNLYMFKKTIDNTLNASYFLFYYNTSFISAAPITVSVFFKAPFQLIAQNYQALVGVVMTVCVIDIFKPINIKKYNERFILYIFYGIIIAFFGSKVT